MKNQIITRKAKKEEIPILIKLFWGMVKYHRRIATKDDNYWGKLNQKAQQEMEKFFEKNIRGRKALALVAEDNKKIIGYCLAQIKKNITIYKIKEYGLISDLYVEKNYRGKGLGKKLISESKIFFKKNKIKFMELKVSHNNPAIKFYQKYGFKEYRKEMRMRI